jgi:hypothetical protein
VRNGRRRPLPNPEHPPTFATFLWLSSTLWRELARVCSTDWKPVLFVACAGTEMWYMSLYILAHVAGPPVAALGGVPAVRVLLYVCTPICAFKQVANLVQMGVAFEALVEHEAPKAKAK